MIFLYRVEAKTVVVWKDGWPSERRQILTHGEFAVFRSACERFEIPLMEECE